MAKLVSKTYGDALFALAMEENRLEELFQSACMVADIIRKDDDFNTLMNHPGIIKEHKVKVVEESFGGKIPKEIIGLMSLMITKSRSDEIVNVLDYFIALVKEEMKIGNAHVTTAIPLNETQKEKVEKKLLETTKYLSLDMCYEVDETLIGGMVIRIGDRVIDSSIKTKLYDLSKELRNIQV